MDGPPLAGILNLDKPPGLSSARAVAHVKRLLPRGTKVGHAGTLDPFATGVLLILVGRATRLCESLMAQSKGYDATLKLGATTPTLDPESPEIVTQSPISPPDRATVETVVSQFIGTIPQRPPAFSAMKIAGRRAYDLARKGHEVHLPERPVRIDRIDILSYHWPELRISMECGRGTYVRSLARDIGDRLAVGAYLTALRRTKIGAFHADQSIPPERLTADTLRNHLHPLPPPHP